MKRTLAALALITSSLGAQESSSRFMLEAGIARMQLSGKELERIKPGFGFDLTAVVPVEKPFVFAIGVEYIKHATNDTTIGGEEIEFPDKLGILTLYVEPRATFGTHGRITPYAWIRVGYVRASQTISLIDSDGLESTGLAVQTGPGIGGGLALRYQASEHISVHGSVGAQHMSFGDLDFDFTRVDGSTAKGLGIIARAGVLLDFAPTNALKSFFRR
jgi:opacity protein-like surface antigen